MTDPGEWYAMPVLAGRLVRLEPLAAEHAAGYLSAAGEGADAEDVFRWLRTPGSTSGAPRTLADARADVVAALAAPSPWRTVRLRAARCGQRGVRRHDVDV